MSIGIIIIHDGRVDGLVRFNDFNSIIIIIIVIVIVFIPATVNAGSVGTRRKSDHLLTDR